MLKIYVHLFVVWIALATCLAGCQTESHAEKCDTEVAQAIIKFEKHDYVESEKLFESAVKEAELSDNLLQLPNALIKMADLLIAENKLSTAESSVNLALNVYNEALGKEKRDGEHATIAEDRITALLKLGVILQSENKIKEAESVYKTAWAESRQIIGSLNTHEEVEKQYLAVLRKEGKTEEADEIEIKIEAENPEANQHIVERRAYEDLWQLKYEEAEKKFKIMDLLSIQRKTPGDHYAALKWIALCEYFMDHAQQAEKYAREQLDAARASKQDSSEHVAQSLTVLALTLEGRDDKQSKACLAEAIKVDKLGVAQVFVDVANMRRTQAASAFQSQEAAVAKDAQWRHTKLERAEKLYSTAFQLAAAEMKARDPHWYFDHLLSMCDVYASMEKLTPACSCYRQYVQNSSKPLNLPNYCVYIDLLLRNKKSSEAQSVLTKAAEQAHKTASAMGANELVGVICCVRQAITLKRYHDAQAMANDVIASPHAKVLSQDQMADLKKLLATAQAKG